MSDSDSSACSSSNSSVYASGTSSAYPSGSSSACSSGAKLWIGNIDQKIDEYQLLKICEKFGQVTQFDFLYHINDRGDRTPRGYAFVTFGSGNSASEAIKCLHKKKILTKELLVRYAAAKTDQVNGSAAGKPIPAALTAGNPAKQSSDADKLLKIRQLEAKLRTMEEGSRNHEFKVSSSASSSRKKPY